MAHAFSSVLQREVMYQAQASYAHTLDCLGLDELMEIPSLLLCCFECEELCTQANVGS